MGSKNKRQSMQNKNHKEWNDIQMYLVKICLINYHKKKPIKCKLCFKLK